MCVASLACLGNNARELDTNEPTNDSTNLTRGQWMVLLAAFQRGGFHIPTQIVFLLVRSVAGVAMPREDVLNLADGINFGSRGRRKFGGINLPGNRTGRQDSEGQER